MFLLLSIVLFSAHCMDFAASQMPPPANFLLIAQASRIGRMKLTSKRLEPITSNKLKAVIAVEYDIENDCLFYADSHKRTIARTCPSHNCSNGILVEDVPSVEGMSFDWVSRILYYTNPSHYRIEAVKVPPLGASVHNESHYTVIDAGPRSHLRGVAVSPIHGYVFWTDWSTYTPSISRANLDGSQAKALLGRPRVYWPNGIAVDDEGYRVYWVDADLDAISRCDFDGRHFENVLKDHVWIRHPFAIAVRGNDVYWNDWALNAVFVTDKVPSDNVSILDSGLIDLRDLKYVAASNETNACRSKHTLCSHVCVGAPNATYSCMCPDGLTLSDGRNCESHVSDVESTNLP